MPNRTGRPAALLILLVAIAAAGCGSSTHTPTATRVVAPTGSPGPITLEIVSPAAGSTVTNPYTVDVRVSGVQIAPASQGVPGAAHFHFFIDQEPPAEGQVIPSGTGIIHTTEPSVERRDAIGQHKVTVVLGDNAHRRLQGAQVATVTFTVGQPTPPQGTPTQ